MGAPVYGLGGPANSPAAIAVALATVASGIANLVRPSQAPVAAGCCCAAANALPKTKALAAIRMENLRIGLLLGG